MKLTIITTIEPCSGKSMTRPACEIYHTSMHCLNNVLRREYINGIATWANVRNVHETHLPSIQPVGDYF